MRLVTWGGESGSHQQSDETDTALDCYEYGVTGSIASPDGSRYAARRSFQLKFTGTDEFYFRLRYRLSSANSAEQVLCAFTDGSGLERFHNGNENADLAVRITTAQAVKVTREQSWATTLATTATGLIVPGTFHMVQGYVKVANSGGRFVLRLDETTVVDFTGDTLSTINVSGGAESIILLGDPYATGGLQEALVDLVAVNDTTGTWENSYPLANAVVRRLAPVGLGDKSDLIGTPEVTDRHLNIDETPPDDADYNYDSVAGQYELYTLADPPAETGQIRAVTVWARTSYDVGFPATFKFVTKTAGGETRSGALNPTANVTFPPYNGLDGPWFRHVTYGTNPVTGNPWTLAQVLALQAGVEVNSNEFLQLRTFFVEVEYVEAAAAGEETRPVPMLEIAFGIDASVEPAANDWVDVSDYLRDFDGGPGGRQRDLERFEAGEMTFVLDNHDRRFDPEYAAGPYFPDVRPRTHIRLTEPASGERVFRGFVQGWPQQWQGRHVGLVTVPCVDAFEFLASTDLPTSRWAQIIADESPLEWWRLGEIAESAAVRDASDNRWDASALQVTFGEDGLVAFDADTAATFTGTANVTSMDGQTATEPVTVEAWIRVGDTSGADVTMFVQQNASSRVSFDIATNGKVQIYKQTSVGFTGRTSTVTVDDNAIHHVVGVLGGTPKVYVDGVDVTAALAGVAGGTGTSLTVIGNNIAGTSPFTGTLDEVVAYSTALSGAAVSQHYTAGVTPFEGDTTDVAVSAALDAVDWPTGLRDIETGAGTLQAHAFTGPALGYLQRIVETEEGLLYVSKDGKVTFRSRDSLVTPPKNTSVLTLKDDVESLGDVPYEDITLEHDLVGVYNEAQVGREGGTVYTVGDATAQTRDLKRTFARTDLLHETDLETIDHGQWIVATKKDPRTEAREVVVLLDNPDVSPGDVLALELGDVVTVVRRPTFPAGSASVEKECRVEKVAHSGNVESHAWRVTLRLSPRDDAADQPWLLDDTTYSVLGSTTRLGF